ncbi:MAG: tRNA preQ1(34) S-adenosylmethionine ribosyltransferase-isomerase QueA [Candidatus Electrothrix sp. YB6]
MSECKAAVPKNSVQDRYQLSSYDYFLPEEQIAQQPAARREQARLLVLNCVHNTKEHTRFETLRNLLRSGDLLVINNTKVFPARLFGRKQTGGRVEMLLLHFPVPVPDTTTDGVQKETTAQATALALIKSSKRPKTGSILYFTEALQVRVDVLRPDGKAEVTLFHSARIPLELLLEEHGDIPLPPYIRRPDGSTTEDARRYQTRYARHVGSVAAPTAGLHFNDGFLQKLQGDGISLAEVTLHVGYGTFAPVRCEDIRQHRLHKEFIRLPPETAEAINTTRKNGGRIWAVGTTTARTLEFAAGDTDKGGEVQPVEGLCGLYIYPGYCFRIVDNLITNFHLPKSSLLFLVAALAGRERVLAAYQDAVEQDYRFFSYGDAMAIITTQ